MTSAAPSTAIVRRRVRAAVALQPPPGPAERPVPDRRLDVAVRELGDDDRWRPSPRRTRGTSGRCRRPAGCPGRSASGRGTARSCGCRSRRTRRCRAAARRRALAWVTAAITHSVASPVAQEAAAEQPRVGALGRHDVQVPAQRAEADEADHGDHVEQRAALGASGRAAAPPGARPWRTPQPSSRPVARVGVDRYRKSVFEMHRPADVPVGVRRHLAACRSGPA